MDLEGLKLHIDTQFQSLKEMLNERCENKEGRICELEKSVNSHLKWEWMVRGALILAAAATPIIAVIWKVI